MRDANCVLSKSEILLGGSLTFFMYLTTKKDSDKIVHNFAARIVSPLFAILNHKSTERKTPGI